MASQSKAIDDFCRLCAIESQSGVTIYSAEGENLCLEEKIISCLRIEVSRDDMLPKRVCHSCNLLLEDYYRFSERATQVQQTLYFLLGLHLPQERDTELSLVENGVKLESNAIKKELDEFIIQQGNIHVDGERFDVHVSQDPKQYYDMVHQGRIGHSSAEEGSEEFALMSDLIDGNGEVKQIHRRKMLVPKKMVQDRCDIEEVGVDGVEYVVAECRDAQDDYKAQEYVEESIIDDGDEGYDKGCEEDEENRKMEIEWRKTWGILCDQCRNVFPEKTAFDRHYRYSYSQNPVYTCTFCKKSLEKYSSYRLHVFQHIQEGKFKCRFCEKKYCSKEMLEIHLGYLHSQMKIFICEECGTTFTSQQRLDFHRKRHRKPSKEELQCTECGKVLQTRGGLAAHKSVHKLGRHFMCHICGKTFTQKINMQQHVKHHKGEKPYSCDICKKNFAEKSHLNRHKSFHTKDRPFQCPVCKKMYKTERCLKVHSQIHWNRRPYICSVCGKGFLSSTKLKQHHNCHTGERPFACKYCERTFTNYPNWLKHTRRRHKVDHKTGLSLKEEDSQTQALGIPQDALQISESAIEFIEMPDVEVKEDGGRDSVQSHHSVLSMINPSVLEGSHYHQIDQTGDCHYHQVNLIPDLVSSQVVYSDHVIVQQEMLL